MDNRIRTRADPGLLPKGIPLDLLPLLSAYGRDRRVALRIERLPSRARLSRGRNNGDGSWSLTRDELDGLSFIPAKGGSEAPTLIVRVIGLESDNGATLAVLDYPVLPEEESAESEAAADSQDADRRTSEARQLRAELAKTRAALRANQTELASARQLWDVELEERLAEAAADASEKLEQNRAAWQAQSKERATRSDARVEERIARERETWQRESESELEKAEAIWKHGETAHLSAAETKWREQSARALAKETAELKKLREALAARDSAGDNELHRLRDEVETLQSSLSDRDEKLAEVRSAAKREQEAAHAAAQKAVAEAQRAWKAGEASRFAAAETKWQQQSSLVLTDMAKRLEEAEAALGDSRARTNAAQERHDTAELESLREELAAARSALAEREKQLAETGAAQHSRDSAELDSLRDELAAASSALAERDKQLAETHASGSRARKRLEQETAAAIAKASQIWKAGEAARFAALETKWRQQIAQELAKSAEKLEQSERSLRASRLEAETALESRGTAETRRLDEALRAMRSTLEQRDAELREARDAAERAAKGVDDALARARKDWEAGEEARFADAKAKWQEQSERVLKKAQLKFEGAEAALAEARAEANSARDLREGAELRRLRSEFAAARAKVTQLESELGQAQLAATRARERTREEIEAALAKAEEALKTSEAVRIAGIETQERERGARALGEIVARLERTERALKEARAQAQGDREAAAIAAAEAAAKYERTESQLNDALTRIESMRDPANEAELGRLRSELATIQIAYSEVEAEVGRARAEARKVRERWSEQSKAVVMRAEEAWRIDEAKRLTATKRQWERDARAAAVVDSPADDQIELPQENRANRLLLDSALAVALAAIVVLMVTFAPRLSEYWPSSARASGTAMPKSSAQVKLSSPLPPAAPASHAIVDVAAANVRAAPAVTAQVIARLRRGDVVTEGERRGDWVHILASSTAGKASHDGWIYNTSLKAAH